MADKDFTFKYKNRGVWGRFRMEISAENGK